MHVHTSDLNTVCGPPHEKDPFKDPNLLVSGCLHRCARSSQRRVCRRAQEPSSSSPLSHLYHICRCTTFTQGCHLQASQLILGPSRCRPERSDSSVLSQLVLLKQAVQNQRGIELLESSGDVVLWPRLTMCTFCALGSIFKIQVGQQVSSLPSLRVTTA